MRSHRSHYWYRQRGLGLIGWLLTLAIIVALVKVSMVVVPAYSEYWSARGVIRATLHDVKGYDVGIDELRHDIAKRFAMNRVRVISADELVISHGPEGMQVAFDYDVVKPLFYNVSLQLHFASALPKL